MSRPPASGIAAFSGTPPPLDTQATRLTDYFSSFTPIRDRPTPAAAAAAATAASSLPFLSPMRASAYTGGGGGGGAFVLPNTPHRLYMPNSAGAAATTAAAAAATTDPPKNDTPTQQHKVTEVIHRHIRQAPEIVQFVLPPLHTFIVDKEPCMTALYYFIRGLAACEPHNPTNRVASELQYKVDRMNALWLTDTKSVEYARSADIIRNYRTALHDAKDMPAEIDKLRDAFRTNFNRYMGFFIDAATASLMRLSMTQIRATPGSDILNNNMTLVDLLCVTELRDLFVLIVNARKCYPSAPSGLRGLSNKSSDILDATFQDLLDKMVNATCIKDAAGETIRWEI